MGEKGGNSRGGSPRLDASNNHVLDLSASDSLNICYPPLPLLAAVLEVTEASLEQVQAAA